jgi:hypothetical protein
MKLYTLHQHTFHEGHSGDLEYSGLVLIGVYTDKSIPQTIINNFIPVEFYTQFGRGLQDLVLTEINSDTQLTELCTNDNIFHFEYEEEDVSYVDEDLFE